MTSQPLDRSHPVAEFAHRLSGRLDELATTPVWSMAPAEQRDALRRSRQGAGTARRALAQGARRGRQVRGHRHRSRLVRSRVARGGDPAGPARCARGPQARHALESHQTLSSAMAQGAVNVPQARAIVKALDRLPATGPYAVTTEQHQLAEQPPGRSRPSPRRQGARRARCTDLRGHRPRGRRGVRGQGPRRPGSSRPAPHHAARCGRTTKAPATAASASRCCTGTCCASSCSASPTPFAWSTPPAAP